MASKSTPPETPEEVSQPETPQDATPTVEERGPWWVKDANGHQFATYLKADGLEVLDESPFTRDGFTLRTAIPAGAADPAEAVQEGESK